MELIWRALCRSSSPPFNLVLDAGDACCARHDDALCPRDFQLIFCSYPTFRALLVIVTLFQVYVHIHEVYPVAVDDFLASSLACVLLRSTLFELDIAFVRTRFLARSSCSRYSFLSFPTGQELPWLKLLSLVESLSTST